MYKVKKENNIILVNEKDEQIGVSTKKEVHEKGILHRAFSTFILNKNKELLLQKRSSTKYHSKNLWSNTSCSHPWNDDILQCAKENLFYEMGIECQLKQIFKINYKCLLDNSLIENEIDHIFIGYYDKNPKPNKNEVSDWTWMHVEKIEQDIKTNSHKYSCWIKKIFPLLKHYFREK